MKKIQKIALALVVGVMAIGFSAFKIAKVDKANFATQTYYHIGDEFVPLSNPPSGQSCLSDDYFCTVTITATTLPGTFDEDQIPAGATKGTPDRSWQ